jgi:acyl-coenzyme A synthetase/AMP-(fatty) acid ligase/acyl carrier protein
MDKNLQQKVKAMQIELQSRCRHPEGKWEPFNWENPPVTFPKQFTHLAEQYPDRVAVVDHAVSLTFAEVEQAANAVAEAILEKTGPGQEPVAMLVGLDARSFIASLGIMKAGKFYVSLEETFPLSRHQQILEDTGAKLILLDKPNIQRAKVLAGTEKQLIQLESLPSSANPPQIPPPSLDDLALMNYTSGTTGAPKGVMQTHRSAMVLSNRFLGFYHTCAVDRVATFQYLAWAGNYWTSFGALTHGASIAIFDTRRNGLGGLVDWMKKVKPTIVVGHLFLKEISKEHPDIRLPSVRVVATGGDTIYKDEVVSCQKNFPNSMIAIGLGISEAGMTTQILIDKESPLEDEIIPLGYPSPGLKFHLLSEKEEPVAPGEIGEMVVEAPILAAGYWMKPDLTAEKFRSVEGNSGRQLYFSGDLGRVREDGMLQHMGRAHHMIKIRGLQVFPKEIDALLQTVPGMSEVCVTDYTAPESPTQLVGYVVVDREKFIGVDSLYEKLEHLPNHMKPQNWVFMDEMPHTSTGKIDRKQLPEPTYSRLNVSADYLPPTNLLEKQLASIWTEILGIEGIGINDHFLELGGDSLAFTRIISKIRESMEVNIPFHDAFNALSIGALAEVVRKQMDNGNAGQG